MCCGHQGVPLLGCCGLEVFRLLGLVSIAILAILATQGMLLAFYVLSGGWEVH